MITTQPVQSVMLESINVTFKLHIKRTDVETESIFLSNWQQGAIFQTTPSTVSASQFQLRSRLHRPPFSSVGGNLIASLSVSDDDDDDDVYLRLKLVV